MWLLETEESYIQWDFKNPILFITTIIILFIYYYWYNANKSFYVDTKNYLERVS